MKRLLAVAFLLILVASACPQQQATQTDDESPAPTEEPQENLADWAALDGIADRLGLDDDQKAEIAATVEDDPAGDQYHPGGELTPMENTDITRTAAFSLDLDQAQADELFNATEFPCSSPADLPGLGDGGLLVWCRLPVMAMPPGQTNFYCGLVDGRFPTSVTEPNVNYEYGVAFRYPSGENGENFQAEVEGDLFAGANLALVWRYNSQGAMASALRHQGQGRGFAEEEIPFRGLLAQGDGRSTFCGVVPNAAIGEQVAYPYRVFTFCGNFGKGAADISNNGDPQGFHDPVSLMLDL